MLFIVRIYIYSSTLHIGHGKLENSWKHWRGSFNLYEKNGSPSSYWIQSYEWLEIEILEEFYETNKITFEITYWAFSAIKIFEI